MLLLCRRPRAPSGSPTGGAARAGVRSGPRFLRPAPHKPRFSGGRDRGLFPPDLDVPAGQRLFTKIPLVASKTKEAFIAAELPGETLRSVQRNVLVARCFSPDEEAKHGIAFLEEVALYAKELTAAEQPPPAIHLDKLTLTLPGKAGATLRKKASAATIDDVRQARRSLRKGAATRRDASPIETALRAALGEQKALSAVTVRATKDHAAFGNVPVAELASFAKAVGKAKLPPS